MNAANLWVDIEEHEEGWTFTLYGRGPDGKPWPIGGGGRLWDTPGEAIEAGMRAYQEEEKRAD